MSYCKKIIITTLCAALLPTMSWSAAPVVDDSDNFAILEPQGKYPGAADEEPVEDKARLDLAQRDSYPFESAQEDGPALAKEEPSLSNANNEPASGLKDNATLLNKLQSLEKEVQNLRGQLEVQSHELKLLQQQQLAFYKDFDARLSTGPGKAAINKIAPDLGVDPKSSLLKGESSTKLPVQTKPIVTAPTVNVLGAVSKANPADEQISYLAAYELVKNKHNDEAIQAMQTFTRKYPKGGYTANAEYWLGELYLAKKDFKQASAHFEVVISQYPSSSKVADSLYKDGFSLAALGYETEAQKRYKEVVVNYPGTPTARLASARLKSSNAL